MSDDWKTRVTQIRPVEKQAVDPEQAVLVLIYPPGSELGKRYELAGRAEVVIGRGADCDIQVDRDSVSRRHAKVSRAANMWQVADLGSPTPPPGGAADPDSTRDRALVVWMALELAERLRTVGHHAGHSRAITSNVLAAVLGTVG